MEEITGEEEEKECAGEKKHKVAEAADPGILILFGVQSIEQSAGHKVLWPHHACGPDQKSPTETGETKSGQLGGKDDDNSEPKAKRKVVINLGHYDRVDSISGADRYISHDENKNVLLDAPWTRVKREPRTTKEVGQAIDGEWELISQIFAKRVGQEKKDNWKDKWRRLTEVEKHVHGTAVAKKYDAMHKTLREIQEEGKNAPPNTG